MAKTKLRKKKPSQLSVAALAPTMTFAEAAMKAVTFTCSNPSSILGITAAHVSVPIIGSRTVNLPFGTFSLFWRIQGSGPFTVTVNGAQISAPIAGTGTDAGVRVIQV
ncbi:MAG: hypothetical protein ABL986_07930 [Vicinamibacterales bacterium]